MPRFPPKNVEPKKLESTAQTSSNVMTGVVVSQILIQVALKGAMSRIWNLYFSMQMYVYLMELDVQLPFVAEAIMKEMKKMIEFFLFTPDGIMQTFIDPFFKLQVFLKE